MTTPSMVLYQLTPFCSSYQLSLEGRDYLYIPKEQLKTSSTANSRFISSRRSLRIF